LPKFHRTLIAKKRFLFSQTKSFKKYVELYAKDEKKYFEDFAKAFKKLLELGVPFSEDAKEYVFKPVSAQE